MVAEIDKLYARGQWEISYGRHKEAGGRHAGAATGFAVHSSVNIAAYLAWDKQSEVKPLPAAISLGTSSVYRYVELHTTADRLSMCNAKKTSVLVTQGVSHLLI